MRTSILVLLLSTAGLLSFGCDDQSYARSDLILDPIPEPCAEQGPESLCNGLDDDCDGAIDEGLGLGERCEGFAEGGCATLVRACGDSGGVVCVPDLALADGEACQDVCLEGGTCQDGQCVGAEPRLCDDGDTCTSDVCLSGTGCVHETRRTPECCALEPEPLGTADLFGRGRVEDVFVDGNTAFMAAGRLGLHVADVSDPTAPRKLAWLDTPGWAIKLALQADVLYIGERTAGDQPTAMVRLVDVENPAQPVNIGDNTAETQYLVTDVEVQGDVAFVLHYSGLRIVDISDPIVVTELASVFIDSARAIEVQGDRAYVLRADAPGNIEIYDVSEPSDPRFLTRVNDALSYAQGLTLHKDRLYVSKYDRMTVYDVSGATPREIGEVGRQAGRDIFVEGDTLYLAGSRGFRVYDAANPSPELLASRSTPEDTTSVFARRDTAYVGIGQGPPLYANPSSGGFLSMEGGLQIYDTSDPSAPTMVGNAFSPGASRRVAVEGVLAYVADLGGGVRIFDVSNPRQPVERHRVGFPDAIAREVVIVGDRLFVALGTESASRIEIFDKTAPLSPVKLGEHSVEGERIQIEVEGDNIFATTSGVEFTKQQLSILTMDEAGGIELAHERLLGTYRGDLEVDGDVLYIAAETLMAFDVSNPAEPELLGESEPIFSSITLEKGDDGLLFGTGAAISNRLMVWDVQDPSVPTLIGTADFNEPAEGLAYRDGFLFVASGEAGVRVFDVTDSTEPRQIAQMPTVDHAWDVGLSGNTLFIADAHGLLQTANLSCR